MCKRIKKNKHCIYIFPICCCFIFIMVCSFVYAYMKTGDFHEHHFSMLSLKMVRIGQISCFGIMNSWNWHKSHWLEYCKFCLAFSVNQQITKSTNNHSQISHFRSIWMTYCYKTDLVYSILDFPPQKHSQLPPLYQCHLLPVYYHGNYKERRMVKYTVENL